MRLMYCCIDTLLQKNIVLFSNTYSVENEEKEGSAIGQDERPTKENVLENDSLTSGQDDRHSVNEDPGKIQENVRLLFMSTRKGEGLSFIFSEVCEHEKDADAVQNTT